MESVRRRRSKRLAAVIGAILVCAATAGAAAERVLVEAILIRVNDRIVTMSDFRQRLEVELSQIPSPPSGKELERFAH